MSDPEERCADREGEPEVADDEIRAHLLEQRQLGGDVPLERGTLVEPATRLFALAAALLPPEARDSARIVYAWCRRADDRVDLCAAGDRHEVLRALSAELDTLYGEANLSAPDPILAALREVIAQTGIQREYLEELLRGMRMDADGHRYARWEDLLLYCFRVAGTVGLMMCHVLGVRDRRALRHAAHLGMAMQLTNIARDVAEDWRQGRLYVPDELLSAVGCGGLAGELGRDFPVRAVQPMAHAMRRLLEEAAAYYRSGDLGLPYLSPRSGWAIGTARRVYAGIGDELARQSFDVLGGRAHVGAARKLWLALQAGLATVGSLPARRTRPADGEAPLSLGAPLRFPDDVLPL